MDNDDSELALLERVYEAQKKGNRLTQRDLAEASGLSLGMTNALVKRLAERGWLSLTRFSTKSFRYALTPEGVGEVASRTAGYFRRASRSATLYRDHLEEVVLAAKRKGIEILILAGVSEVDFLLDYICDLHGLAFIKSAEPERAERLALGRKTLVVWSESLDREAKGEGEIALRDFMILDPKERL
jgi:DNA-binding MarR family transcriptional regulator